MASSEHLTPQTLFPFAQNAGTSVEVPGIEPYYSTNFGSAYLADSRAILKALPEGSVNLVMTSPPYALHFKKEYGNVEKQEYVDWFATFAEEIFRVLAEDGSFVLNIGGSYEKGQPTRSLYHFKLLIHLVEEIGFHLAQECFWFNPAKMPVPAEWVNVRRMRIKDSVEYVWWLSKTPWPKADNRAVLKEYSPDMKRLNERGVRATVRPSGHNIKASFTSIEHGGSIPPNVIEEAVGDEREFLNDLQHLLQGRLAEDLLKFGNNSANDLYTKRCKQAGIRIHPARFPGALPEFFIKLLTSESDLVFDPFAGSNTTGAVAEQLERRWIAADTVEDYLKASRFRFS